MTTLHGTKSMARNLSPDAETLAGFCRQHHIRRLALFGSRLKGTARPDSDIDLLVEFEQGHIPGLLGISGLEIELSGLMGCKVDCALQQIYPAISGKVSFAVPRSCMQAEDHIRT